MVSTPQPLETGTGQSDCERKIEIQRDWGEEEGLWLPSLGNVSILGLACASQGCEEPARPHRPSLAVPGDSAPAYTSPGSVGACLPYLPCLPCIQLSTSLLDRWLLSPSCSHSVFLPLFSSTLPPHPHSHCADPVAFYQAPTEEVWEAMHPARSALADVRSRGWGSPLVSLPPGLCHQDHTHEKFLSPQVSG